VACRVCGRRFVMERLAKHQDICSRTRNKRRPAYDAAAKRIRGEYMKGAVSCQEAVQ
jgi:hypothetical protein